MDSCGWSELIRRIVGVRMNTVSRINERALKVKKEVKSGS